MLLVARARCDRKSVGNRIQQYIFEITDQNLRNFTSPVSGV